MKQHRRITTEHCRSETVQIIIDLPPGADIRVEPGRQIKPDTVIAVAPASLEYSCIDLAATAGIDPAQTNRLLTRYIDEKIHEDETIAETPGLLSMNSRHIRAGRSGVIKFISERTGIVLLENRSGSDTVSAEITGVVDTVTRSQITVSSRGTILPAHCCAGKLSSGLPVTYSRGLSRDTLKNRVIINDGPAKKTDLDFYRQAGAAAVITAGVDGNEMARLLSLSRSSDAASCPVAVMTGFGNKNFEKTLRTIFEKSENTPVTVIPATGAATGTGEVLIHDV